MMMQGATEFAPQDALVNVDMEMALIGAVLMRNSIYQSVIGLVNKEHFFDPVLQHIWDVMGQMAELDQAITPLTLKTHLGDVDVGGKTLMQFLASTMNEATNLASAVSYAKMIRDLAIRRSLVELGKEIARSATFAPVNATSESLMAELESRFELLKPSTNGDMAEFRDFGAGDSTHIYDAYKRGTGLVGLSTGLGRLDAILGGLQKSDLIVVGGRPGSGKTALCTNIAVWVARHVQERMENGEKLGWVGFNSLEMSMEQLRARVLADMSRVPLWKLNRGLADRSEMERYIQAERDFRRLPLAIDETGGLSIAQVKMRARSLKKKRGLSLLVVDYLQLMRGSRHSNNRNEEIGQISTGLKELAKELQIPIIAISQLNRASENRDDRRPQLSDLKESGSIEQDADSVCMVYREEYYLRKSEPRDQGSEAWAKWDAAIKRWGGVAEISVLKNRHGSEGVAELGFEGEFTRFLGEPAPREIIPAQVRREAAKRPSVSRDGATLKGILRSLLISKGVACTDQQRTADKRLPKGMPLIPMAIAQKEFGQETMPGADEAKVASSFQAAMKSLRSAGIAYYTGTSESGYHCWLPELSD